MESFWHYLSHTVLQVSVKFTVNGKKARSVVAQSLGNLFGLFSCVFVCFLFEECEEGWETPGENSNCYKLFTEKKTWDAANDDCRNISSHLVKVDSEEENTFLLRTFLQIPKGEVNREAWIGLTDKLEEGEFVWTDGTPAEYTNWADEQPNDEDNEQDCGEMANGVFWLDGPPQIGVWNDFQCDENLMYICEKEP